VNNAASSIEKAKFGTNFLMMRQKMMFDKHSLQEVPVVYIKHRNVIVVVLYSIF
jgi:hypothetical protein